ncbi:nucleic acid-binding protein [Sporosarcina sp. P21c]|nr:nucleic acid-binding protein [Sporosarcina sp. P16a]PIC83801.1 nucleic acid-binding protein [Sporosarcina sp. P1]PIC90667.1 nucleic acid-binding protein [Sporosarcina sp. P21c]PIC93432.1 nucleic acid-binding protein [Sporosarcina sp. P25]
MYMVKYSEVGVPTPKPMMSQDTEKFWRLLQEEKQLHLQKCNNCQTYSHPPRVVCSNCHSFDLGWVPSEGKGVIHSYVIYHRSVHPGFKTPYGVILVELEEGVRIISNMVDCEPHEIEIGMPVEAVVDQVFEDTALVKFKRINN